MFQGGERRNERDEVERREKECFLLRDEEEKAPK